jgi:hypothetical protein
MRVIAKLAAGKHLDNHIAAGRCPARAGRLTRAAVPSAAAPVRKFLRDMDATCGYSPKT